VPVRKLFFSLSLWGRAGVGVNNIRRLPFPPPTPPRGRGVLGQALFYRTYYGLLGRKIAPEWVFKWKNRYLGFLKKMLAY